VNVILLDYTRDALELLLFTKQTRLSQTAGLFHEIKAWPAERKLKELGHVLHTIQSSWEMVNYTFLIQEVSRAFTHQLVRHRHASYAQQSQRAVDMSEFVYLTPPALREAPDSEAAQIYRLTMAQIKDGYQEMLAAGAPPQDARGVLPTNVATQIIMQVNLRSLSEQMRLRLCTRTQGETQDVFRRIRQVVLDIHPWAEPFLRVHCAATGVCLFPDFQECPIKPAVFNPATGHRWDWDADGGREFEQRWPATCEEIQATWETTRFEAVPTPKPQEA